MSRRELLDLFEKKKDYMNERINNGIEMYRKGYADLTVTDETAYNNTCSLVSDQNGNGSRGYCVYLCIENILETCTSNHHHQLLLESRTLVGEPRG